MGVPLHIVPRRRRILDHVTAMYLTLMGIHLLPKLVGRVCAWRIGHAGNVYATCNRLAPEAGVVELGHELVRLLRIIQGLVVGQWILHSTIRRCFWNGLRIVMLIGSAHDFFVSDCVAQVQR